MRLDEGVRLVTITRADKEPEEAEPEEGEQELPQEGEAVDMQEADEIEGPVEPDQPAPFEENSDVTGTED